MTKTKKDQIEQLILFHPVSGTGFEIEITQGEIIDEMKNWGLTIGGVNGAKQEEVARGILDIAKAKVNRGNYRHIEKSKKKN